MSTLLESRIVGAVLANSDALHELPAGFSSGVVKRPELRAVLKVVEGLAERKALPAGPVDVRLVVEAARLGDRWPSALEGYVAEARIDGKPAAEYARALLANHRRASLGALLAKAQEELGGEATPEEIAERIQVALLEMGSGDRRETVSERETTLELCDMVESSRQGKGYVVRSGLDDVDSVLWMRRGNLIVLAAIAGCGKTTLGLQIAGTVSGRKEHVLVHSLEMTRHELQAVNLAREARVDSRRFFDDRAPLDKEEQARVLSAADRRLGNSEGFLHFNDEFADLGAICRITEKHHRKHGLSLAVVDYLQLVKVSLGKNGTREREVAMVSGELKRLAMRLGIPILALSQINREGENGGRLPGPAKCKHCGRPKAGHDNPRRGENIPPHRFEAPLLPAPKIQHLRESGAIGQDANAVAILHNPYAESESEHQRVHGPFELHVVKQRMGPKGIARLYADLEKSAFRPHKESVVSHIIREEA